MSAQHPVLPVLHETARPSVRTSQSLSGTCHNFQWLSGVGAHPGGNSIQQLLGWLPGSCCPFRRCRVFGHTGWTVLAGACRRIHLLFLLHRRQSDITSEYHSPWFHCCTHVLSTKQNRENDSSSGLEDVRYSCLSPDKEESLLIEIYCICGMEIFNYILSESRLLNCGSRLASEAMMRCFKRLSPRLLS